MNKRIREFERESGLEIYGLGAKRDRWEHTMEKFTMLVVKECMDVVSKKCASPTAYRALAEHFGVEE